MGRTESGPEGTGNYKAVHFHDKACVFIVSVTQSVTSGGRTCSVSGPVSDVWRNVREDYC